MHPINDILALGNSYRIFVLQPRFHRIFVAVLNNSNLLETIPVFDPNDYVIFLSALDLSTISIEGLNKLLSLRYPVVPSTENYQFIKKTDAPRLYGWAMGQPREIKAITRNGAAIWAMGQPREASRSCRASSSHYENEKNEAWHREYRGQQGYAVASGSVPQQYAYSKIIANPSKKLIFWCFDGISFRELIEE